MQKSRDQIHILVVDDEEQLRKSIALNLELDGFKVTSAGGADEAVEVVKKEDIDFVLSDIRMPQKSGVNLLEDVRAYNEDLPIVVLMTGFSEVEEKKILDKGATSVLKKPLNLDELTEFIEREVNKE